MKQSLLQQRSCPIDVAGNEDNDDIWSFIPWIWITRNVNDAAELNEFSQALQAAAGVPLQECQLTVDHMTHERINLVSTGYIRPIVLACLLFAVQIAVQGWTDWVGPVGGSRLRARLLDEADNSKGHAASVEVEVKNVWLHAPSPCSAYAYGVVAGVLRYQLDNNPSVVTSDHRLRFEQLPSGAVVPTNPLSTEIVK